MKRVASTGIRHDTGKIRELTGADEMLIVDRLYTFTPAEVATTVIAASTTRIGALRPPSLDDVRALTVGDRERLLLAIYRLNIGARIEAVARCAGARCGTVLEFDLAVEDLLDSCPASGIATARTRSISGSCTCSATALRRATAICARRPRA